MGSPGLAALLRREKSGRGARVDQPLITGSLPFMTWRWAEPAAGREQVVDLLLGGAFPCYRVYRCGHGELMAVSALEPKFWIGFVTMLGAGELDRDAAAVELASIRDEIDELDKRIVELLNERAILGRAAGRVRLSACGGPSAAPVRGAVGRSRAAAHHDRPARRSRGTGGLRLGRHAERVGPVAGAHG